VNNTNEEIRKIREALYGRIAADIRGTNMTYAEIARKHEISPSTVYLVARIWNGGLLRRRFQQRHIFARGKRPKVWVARYLEPVLDNGKVRSVPHSKVGGPCSEMSKMAARQTLQGWLRPLNDGLHAPIESASFQQFHDKREAGFASRLSGVNPRFLPKRRTTLGTPLLQGLQGG